MHIDEIISVLINTVLRIPVKMILAILRLPPLVWCVWKVHFLGCWIAYIFSPKETFDIEGTQPYCSGKWLFFVIVGERSNISPWRHVPEVFSQIGYRVVLIVNGTESIAIKLEEEKYITTIIRRKNVGYDFGAWKTAFEALITDETQLSEGDEIILMNDSVYFPSVNPSTFLKWLATEFEFGGAAMNTERDNQPHIQSFFLSIKGQRAIGLAQEFFKKYTPLTSRVWAIHRGEVAFSRYMLSKRLHFSTFLDIAQAIISFGQDRNHTHAAPTELLDIGFPFLKYDLASKRINQIAVAKQISRWKLFDQKHPISSLQTDVEYKEIVRKRNEAEQYLRHLLVSSRPSLLTRFLSIYGIR